MVLLLLILRNDLKKNVKEYEENIYPNLIKEKVIKSSDPVKEIFFHCFFNNFEFK
jgi:hypothetical protein